MMDGRANMIDGTLCNLGLWRVLVILLASLGPCLGQEQPWRVVISGGILQDVEVGAEQARTIAGLGRFFTDRLAVDSHAVQVLCDRQSPVFDANVVACTRDSVRETLADVASSGQTIDRFVFYYIGQANRSGTTLRLNVRGCDIVHGELVRWLGAIEARQKLIVLDCPCAGLAIKGLADPNSIIVCSARGDQYDSPRFSEYFVPALTQWKPDDDADGKLSLLDVFQKTCRDLDAYYASENCYKSENALLEDDADGVASQQPWLFEQSGKDGAKAARFYFVETPVGQVPGG